MMASRGIDVSKHQIVPNCDALKSEGISFVIIRAGLGGIVDARFMQHYTAAINSRLKVGVYWFCYALSVEEAAEEAEDCLRVIDGLSLDLPIFYDFEYDTERYAKERGIIFTPKLRTDIICAFCNRIKAAGYEAGIYTNPDYWLYRLTKERLKGYKLWIAAYTRADAMADFGSVAPEDVPAKYKDAMIWQFGKRKFGRQQIDIDYGYFGDGGYKVGGKYTIKLGDVYSNGKAVPERLVGKSYTIAQVKDDRVLLREIMSWVRV